MLRGARLLHSRQIRFVGRMNYESLITMIDAGEKFEYLLFYGHHPKKLGKVDHSCFSQWYPAEFEVEGVRYKTAEHYMMAQKAKLFHDDDAYDEILRSPDPKSAKQLGRTVQNFVHEIWEERCFEIVVEGNYHKFSQNPNLLSYLLSTDPKILVEASPNDRIWGIGMSKNDPNALIPAHWLGRNLLGFALVEARRRIKSL